MNLIERLGGYERAKDGLHRLKLEKKDLLTCGDLVVVESEIDAALLQYRRQHNIFEVGDKVVLISNSDDDIFEYTEYSKNLDLHFFESKNNYGHASLSNIRHATDAEIKAGKRLDGLKEDV